MAHLINKDALVAELNKLYDFEYNNTSDLSCGKKIVLRNILLFLDTLEVKNVDLNSIAYVITRCEEHSDYVEEVFFDKDKAQEYCDQFNGNDNEYTRDITEVKVTI